MSSALFTFSESGCEMYEKYVKLRDEKGVNDSEVSRETGIARSMFSEWKKGTYKPKAARLEKLAHYFGVEPSYFFDDAQNNAVRTQYNADLMELMHEAQKARTNDLRAVLEHLKRLNQYAEMLDQLEKGKEE